MAAGQQLSRRESRVHGHGGVEEARWRGIERIRLAYFGTADPAHYGIDYEYLPSANVPLRQTQQQAPVGRQARIVALSAYQYQGVGFPDKTIYERFHALVPNDLVGYSILIFDPNNPIQRID